jgi:hypothetical protein
MAVMLKNNIDIHKFEIENLAQKPQRLFIKAGGFWLKRLGAKKN